MSPVVTVKRLCLLCLWCGAMAVLPALATEPQSCSAATDECVAVGEWRFSVGVGLGVRTNPVVEGDNLPILLMPEVSYYGERFFWDTTNIGFTLVETPQHSLNLLATLGLDYIYFRDWSLGNFVIEGGAGNFTVSPVPPPGGVDVTGNDGEEDNAGDDREEEINNPNPGDKDGPNEFFHSPKLASSAPEQPSSSTIHLDKRRMAALAGIDYSFYWRGTVFGAQWLQDVSNVHGGQEVRLGVDHRWQLGASRLGMAAGAVWQSREVIDYYYGVDPHEVVSDRDFTYSPGSAWTPYVRFDWQQPLTPHWSLQATLHHKWLDTTITRSPIVDGKGSTSVFVGGVYHF